jgi:hypothetical protein
MTYRKDSTKSFWTLAALLAVLVLAGCAGGGRGRAAGALRLLPEEEWRFGTHPGRIILAPNYRLHATLTEEKDDAHLLTPAAAQRVAMLMEAARGEYQRVTPGLSVPAEARPLECYLFATRRQWAEFTARHAGEHASIYLQINRGGYTQGDVFVAFWLGDDSTMSVAAHEGWHQYLGRHFSGRLPPALEEGLACTFENVRWSDGRPVFDRESNYRRSRALGKAVADRQLVPLQRLLRMHAGEVVEQGVDGVEAWYGQAWALARFLWIGENGRYRVGLQKLLADAAAGTIVDPTGSHRDKKQPWDPSGVGVMFEHYFGKSLEEMDGEYRQFVKQYDVD